MLGESSSTRRDPTFGNGFREQGQIWVCVFLRNPPKVWLSFDFVLKPTKRGTLKNTYVGPFIMAEGSAKVERGTVPV